MNIEMNQTTDYDKFKFLELNRNICKSHVENLIKLNKERNRFHLFPIVVDEDMNIIDGQHRYTACKQSELPVFYIVDNKSTEDKFTEITKVNTATKCHSYLEIFTMLLKDKDRTATMIKTYQTVLKNNHNLHVDIFHLIRMLTVTITGSWTSSWPTGTTMKDNMRNKKFHLAEDSDYRLAMIILIDNKCGFGDGNMSSVFKSIYTIFKKNEVPIEEGIERLANNGFTKNNALKGLTYNQMCTHLVKTYNKHLRQSFKIAE